MSQEYLVDGDWPKHCLCGRRHYEQDWGVLELDSWRHQKSHRPQGMTIETRTCPCGRSIAHVEFDAYEQSFDTNEREAAAPPIPGAPTPLGI